MTVNLGAILTAMVTPFDADGRVDEDAAVRLDAPPGRSRLRRPRRLRHDRRGVDARRRGAPRDDPPRGRGDEASGCTIVAGVGSNDTRHAVYLTERATELGADALLSVNPYYNRPSRRGIVRHYEEVSRATDLPIVLYNIPQRTGRTCPMTCSPSSPSSTTSSPSSRPTPPTSRRSTVCRSTRATTTCSPTCSTSGSRGGILVASHLFGDEMRRMVDEPERRREIDESLQDVYRDLGDRAARVQHQGRAQPARSRRRRASAALCRSSTSGRPRSCASMLERHGMLATAA